MKIKLAIMAFFCTLAIFITVGGTILGTLFLAGYLIAKFGSAGIIFFIVGGIFIWGFYSVAKVIYVDLDTADYMKRRNGDKK